MSAGAGLLRRAQSLAALLGILLLAIIISPTASDGSRIFLQAGNLTDILRQISLIGIISLAMTFVILTGGIDLSVGSILALSTALVAMFLTRGYTTHIAVAILAAVAASALAGALNGVVIARTRHSAVHRDAGLHDRRARPGQVAHQQSEHRYRFRHATWPRSSPPSSARRPS